MDSEEPRKLKEGFLVKKVRNRYMEKFENLTTALTPNNAETTWHGIELGKLLKLRTVAADATGKRKQFMILGLILNRRFVMFFSMKECFSG